MALLTGSLLQICQALNLSGEKLQAGNQQSEQLSRISARLFCKADDEIRTLVFLAMETRFRFQSRSSPAFMPFSLDEAEFSCCPSQ